MAGQKFQYDESGGTFYYFVLSFLALILIPTTIYYWPRKKKEDPGKRNEECQCDDCRKKKTILANAEPYRALRSWTIKLVIVLGWALLLFLTYRVSQFDYEMASFDPFEILNVPPTSSQAEIKKAYYRLSKILHPDKETGDEKSFMMLSKAYQALTDDVAKENYEKYGNPDGPGAMSFGIALPSWIVEKENSVWVLGLYGLVFMVAMPSAVGVWWYRSIRFSGDKVLLDTTQMYFYFIHKTPHMLLKRALMVLAASLEFDKRHNSQVTERQSDNDEVPALIRQLPNLNEKCKEHPLCRMYSIKARAILHAHLSRITLNADTLERDRQFIVKKCPYLVQEMVSCVHQLVMMAYARRVPRLPSIETIENCMKMSPMIIQGLWEFKSPLLQLPHLTEDHLYFMNKKRHVKNLQQFAQLKPEEGRTLLKNLSDFEYENTMKVLGKMPLIDFSIRCEVIDDENTNVVTAGAIVTVTVTLERKDMKTLFGDTKAPEKQGINDEANEEAAGDDDEAAAAAVPVKKASAWAKPRKGGKGKGGKKPANNQKKKLPPKATNVAATTASASATGSEEQGVNSEAESDGGDHSDVESVAGSVSEDDEKQNKNNSSLDDDDDEEWERLQQKLNKRERLEGKSRLSHTVHCPFFPEEKQEYWWTYICDRKSRTLLTAPYHVTNLVEKEEIQLKFTAPRWPGVYTFTVCLRSDSYLGMDQQQELKLDVQKAPAPPTDHPQWDLSESEPEHNDQQENLSDYTTDTSDEEDSD
ncbi:translocation protein SEC63 homolog [Drosophila guanche]|uniref:Blast:Translocation protein SEC63 homolog n=1 Tax=Drosophila guanche TaxID=7266 RepID=A0A3B0J9V0_DROGU|nr:translocation protein SEC63 homolog [Drosophila guanche]SPP77173.1 blast:Translocation protein SEC63 homolog [Drosophila guanche]